MSNPSRLMSPAELGAAARALRLHDVTPPLTSDLPVFFMNWAPEREVLAQHEQGAAANAWKVHEHSGAHVDAPFHFDPAGATIDAIPADALFLRPFKKFDLAAENPQPGEPVTRAQLMAAAERAGFELQQGDVAIIDFGWDRYLPGGTDERDPSWWGANEPGLSADACDYLADAGIVAVGCDTAACDLSMRDGEVLGAPGHAHAFLPAGILIVEGLRGLGPVPDSGLFVALPLPLANGTGSPVRVVLLTE